MKFAAIKGQMGIWRYYVTTLSFKDICDYVSPITKEISNSDSYSNLLQRSITNNVEGVKDYLLLQPERFFNSLVLAVYDGNPEWYELDVNVEEYSTYSVGVLELTGNETVFPVDGQHRVAGIKEAVKKDPSLVNEKVPVILIGHENSNEGKRRTRRLFSTLNRRAKRVSDNEIIALDEDDIVAIATREIAECNELFSGDRLIDYANKNIPSTNGKAFTSILELYEINHLIYTNFASEKGVSKAQREKFLLYRPSDEEVNEIEKEINDFWLKMIEKIHVLKEYVTLDSEEAVKRKFRSKEGGNLLFRPLALTQFVNAVYEYKNRKKVTLDEAIIQLGKIRMEIQDRPWKNVLWLDNVKKINGRVSKNVLMRLMLFMADENILKEKEKSELISYILATRDMDDQHKDKILEELRKYVVLEGK